MDSDLLSEAVGLDFVIPQYRDFKIWSYAYSPDSDLPTGIAPTCVWAEVSNRDHARYLNRMGFAEIAGTPDGYEIQFAYAGVTPT